MKKLYILLFTILITSLSFGQVLVAEGFDYADGSLVPNGGWANESGTPGDFLVTSGQAVVQHGSPSEDVKLAFSSVSGDVYAGFDFSVDDLGAPYSGGTDFEYFAHLDFKARLDIVAPSGSGDFSVGISSATSTAEGIWGTDLLFNTTYRAIIKFDQVTGTAQLWISPSASTDTSISGSAPGAFNVSEFELRQSDSSENETVRVDNLMIGQTFDDVLVFAPSTDPTLTIPDAPASGGVLTTTPEAPNDATIDFTTTNFTVAVPSAGDGYIKWNVKDVGDNIIDSGDIFTTDGTETPVTGLVAGNTYTLFAELVNNSGVPITPAVQYTLTVIIPSYTVVTDIAGLRADVTTNGVGGYYEISGNVLVTHTDGFFNRHWVQDNNIAGILITEDGSESPISPYAVGDNVSGLKGGTEIVNGLLRFLPTIDSGVVTSSGSVTPQLVTISDFNTNYADYESELVELQNVTFDAADGVTTFSTGTNYNVSDVTPNTVVMRTDYFGADYIGTVIPSDNITSLVAIAGRFNTTGQIYARSLSDFTLNSKYVEIEDFEMYPNPTSVGYINISSGSNSKMDVSIYSILGRQIISENVNNKRLDISSLKSGVYILKAQQDNAITTKKLVIQ
ncbi:MAG: T9SS type A sorting domain-containing protein [Flaviramulus sp.]|nr:T9SS type A sorting domain-containing protein [Flaviramulus sp.]NNC49072.1 T9SS type A sorting domain-containing protein [Flaviramulus sp.]